MRKYKIGIDVGGTNIAIGLVEDGCKLVDKISIKTETVQEAREMIGAIAASVHDLMKRNAVSEDDIEALGVGVPGTAEPDTGRIMYANNLQFEDLPFLPDLKKALGEPLGSRTFFDNDGNAAAIGEYLLGGYQADNFVMVTLGTGIGGGIIINGKLLRGVNYASAEFGHMTIHTEGIACNCGRKGCFENYASASALIRQVKEAMQEDIYRSSLLWKKVESPEDMNGEIFFEAVREEDETARKVLDTFLTYLSEGLINIINMLQPDVLVLSGGITRAADLYLAQLKEKVSKGIYSRTSSRNTEILVAKGIADAGDVGVIGAALIHKG